MTTALIKHGTIVDGTGTLAFTGSVLVDDDRIAGIFPAGAALPAADSQIDAQGLIVCPGFIDMHPHADWVLPLANHAPILKCLVEQGITTVVAGNRGISPAPMTPDARARTEVLASIVTTGALDYPWRSMADYLTHVESQDPLINMAQLVGHATVRYANSRRDRGDMSPGDLERCLASTRRALEEGACGLSFGLGYDPGMYASLEELEASSRVAAEANGLPNPTATGTFPRILGRFIRDQKLFSVEEAVRRMTHASAERFGLKDVGCLAPGKAVDLVLFDSQQIADNPGGRPTRRDQAGAAQWANRRE